MCTKYILYEYVCWVAGLNFGQMDFFFQASTYCFFRKSGKRCEFFLSKKQGKYGFNNGELECTWPRDLGYVDPSCRELEHF